ncbi:hypothetical protein B0A52_08759 [Exophiala mesophila]|uniref:NAD(P)-binding domain-containing protein n=1 Tax=Exophiala mesophila TaxID=212818 RepID=A0A438MWA7_EXOME|nr:hypothetical protein B0A52_08759 [Exophiala mesophila]
MKVVLSGATGYIGSQVLSRCLEHASITEVLVLSRRDIGPLAQHPKVQVLMMKDFTSYDDPATTAQLLTADAAIWCLGKSSGNYKVDIEFPLAFIKAIKSRQTQGSPGKAFRYLQLSGAFTEPPPKDGQPERPLWFFVQGRRIRGALEPTVLNESSDINGTVDVSHSSQPPFTVYLVKPGGVAPTWVPAFVMKYIIGQRLGVGIQDLAATMVDLVVCGGDQRVFQNREIISYANKLRENPSASTL